MSSFYNNLKAVIPVTELAQKGDLSYISAANALMRAGRPVFEFVEFAGKPMLEVLGGALVAVDIQIEGTASVQRTWLAVMDQLNCPIPIAEMSLTDINNARQRCLVKALAMTHGVALSLFLSCDGNGEKAATMLGVEPDSQLDKVQPVLAVLKDEEKGTSVPYIEWGVALAAARITDPNFYWSVVMWDDKPYRVVLNNVMVDVDVVYQGATQRVSLPLMDSSHRAILAKFANVSDWNKAVMRALTKAIAFKSGYGLSVYAAEEFGSLLSQDNAKVRPAKSQKGKEQKPAQQPDATPAAVPAAQGAQQMPTATQSEPQKSEPVAATPAAPEPAKPQKEETIPVQAEKPAQPVTNNTVTNVQEETPEFMKKFMNSTMSRFEQAKMVGLLSVFDALEKSVKWTPDEKLICIAALMEVINQHITTAHIMPLMEMLSQHPKALTSLSHDRREAIAAKLVSLAMEVAVNAEDDSVLGKLGEVVVNAKVANDVSDMLRLAMLAGVPQEWFEYYDACLMD